MAYKELNKTQSSSPELCRYVDNEMARDKGDPDVLDSDHVSVFVRENKAGFGRENKAGFGRDSIKTLTRRESCYLFKPTPYVLDRIMKHLTAQKRSKKEIQVVPELSAVEAGEVNASFRVFVRVRPPLIRELSTGIPELSTGIPELSTGITPELCMPGLEATGDCIRSYKLDKIELANGRFGVKDQIEG